VRRRDENDIRLYEVCIIASPSSAIFDMQPRTAKSHLSWEKQQEIKEARDVRAKAKRRANNALAKASRRKNR